MGRENMRAYEGEICQVNQACALGDLTDSEARKKRKAVRREFHIKTPLERIIFGQAMEIASTALVKTWLSYELLKPAANYLIGLVN